MHTSMLVYKKRYGKPFGAVPRGGRFREKLIGKTT